MALFVALTDPPRQMSSCSGVSGDFSETIFSNAERLNIGIVYRNRSIGHKRYRIGAAAKTKKSNKFLGCRVLQRLRAGAIWAREMSYKLLDFEKSTPKSIKSFRVAIALWITFYTP